MELSKLKGSFKESWLTVWQEIGTEATLFLLDFIFFITYESA